MALIFDVTENMMIQTDDYLSPLKPPPGFKTVAAWWAEREPEALELLADPVATFYGDAEKLQTICEARSLPFHWVMAPPVFNRVGLAEARAFPVELLAEFYPANP